MSKSENGWEPLHAGPDILNWIRVPGAEHVSLQLMKGWPTTILRAFAADFNAYIEPLRDADSAGFTPTNSVATSNHLNGTGMDLNWDGPPEAKVFRLGIPIERAYPGAKAQALRDLLDWYEDMVFCGGNWSIRDWMHMQMGGDTWMNPRTQDFINRKIRADGFSTYKRGGTVTPPPPPASNALDVLVRATGVSQAKAQEILVGVVNGLRDSQCDNVNRIAMWLAQIGHESAGFNATEEYQNGDESTDRWKYKGRTWIQITWQSNYAGLSKWAFGKGLIPTPTYFVDNPKKLAEIQYAGLGPAWYWTVARPQINSLCDNRDLVAVTQAINGGQNGAADRRTRYDRALALGNQLLVLTAPPTQGEDELSAEAERKIDVIYQELTKKFVSRSPLRPLDAGPFDTLTGFALYTNSGQDVEAVKSWAALGHPASLARLHEIADADPQRYPDRADNIKLAQAILADIEAQKNQPQVINNAAPQGTPVVDNSRELAAAYEEIARLRDENARLQAESAPVPSTALAAIEMPPIGGSTGQIIGQAYDSLQALRLADALPIEERAPLAALISVLSTKNGSQV